MQTTNVTAIGLTAAELALGPRPEWTANPERFEFYRVDNITLRYRINAAGAFAAGGGGGGGDALTTSPLNQFASTTSAQLKSVMSDATGTGALVFGNAPTLVAPVLGTPASGNLGNCTGYPADASKAAKSQTLTFTKSFFVPAPVDGKVAGWLDEEAITITKVSAVTDSGTTTLTTSIAGTNVTGTAVSANSAYSSQSYAAGNISAGGGAKIAITASGSSSPVNLQITVVYTRTFTLG